MVNRVIISVLLASRLGDRLATHLERAHDAGATEGELREGRQLAQMIFGAPSLLYGVYTLKPVVESRAAKQAS